MEARVVLTEGMHFDATVGDGYRLEIDSAADMGGIGRGARPMELLLAGTGGCTSIDVLSILKKARQEITGFEVRLSGDRAEEPPRVFTHIRIEYLVRGRNLSEDVIRRAIELSEKKYCSAITMLGAVAKIESSYRIESE